MSQPVYILAKTPVRGMPRGTYEIVSTDKKLLAVREVHTGKELAMTPYCLQQMLAKGKWDITRNARGS